MRKTTLLITTGVVAASLAGGAAAFAATGATPSPTATDDRSPRTTSPTAPAATAPAATSPTAPAPTGDGTTGSGRSAELDAAIAAAIAEVGPGTVIDADRDDDATHAYEIDIRLDAGGFAEVKLDQNLAIVAVSSDDHGDNHNDDGTPRGGTSGGGTSGGGTHGDDHGDDQVADQAARDAASAAALAATGGGTVVSVEAGDDDHAWEVKVDLGGGDDTKVELDANFQVIEVD